MFVIGLRPEITATFSQAFIRFVGGNNFLQTTRSSLQKNSRQTFFSSSGVSFSNFFYLIRLLAFSDLRRKMIQALAFVLSLFVLVRIICFLAVPIVGNVSFHGVLLFSKKTFPLCSTLFAIRIFVFSNGYI